MHIVDQHVEAEKSRRFPTNSAHSGYSCWIKYKYSWNNNSMNFTLMDLDIRGGLPFGTRPCLVVWKTLFVEVLD